MEQSRSCVEGGAVRSLGALEPRPRVQARTLGHSPRLETQGCPWLGLDVRGHPLLGSESGEGPEQGQDVTQTPGSQGPWAAS